MCHIDTCLWSSSYDGLGFRWDQQCFSLDAYVVPFPAPSFLWANTTVFLQYTSEHHQYSGVGQAWDALKQSATSEHTVAENTRKFWETCPNKFAVSSLASFQLCLRANENGGKIPEILGGKWVFKNNICIVVQQVCTLMQDRGGFLLCWVVRSADRSGILTNEQFSVHSLACRRPSRRAAAGWSGRAKRTRSACHLVDASPCTGSFSSVMCLYMGRWDSRIVIPARFWHLRYHSRILSWSKKHNSCTCSTASLARFWRSCHFSSVHGRINALCRSDQCLEQRLGSSLFFFQYSMHQTFPLSTIWVESMQDTDNLKWVCKG